MKGSDHELGEPGLELAAAAHELVGASPSRAVRGVLGAAVAAAGHREGVLPACRVGVQSSSGLSQLCL